MALLFLRFRALRFARPERRMNRDVCGMDSLSALGQFLRRKIRIGHRRPFYADPVDHLRTRRAWRGTHRVFCLSFQKAGTTSVEVFLRSLGYPVAGWPIAEKNGWYKKVSRGQSASIFSSPDFQCHQAFADTPWYFPGLYIELFLRFPDSKFILLERDPAEWFESLRIFFRGKRLEDDLFHARVYSREQPFVESSRAGRRLTIEPHDAEHYMAVYCEQNRAVREFFGRVAPDNLFHGDLSDPGLWDDLAEFLGEENTVGAVHANRRRERRCCRRP